MKFNVYFVLFVLFWSFYFIKVMYTESISNYNELSRPWFQYIFFALTYIIIPFTAFLVIDIKKYANIILNGFIFSGLLFGILCLFQYGHVLGTGIGRLNQLTYRTGEVVLNPLTLSYSASLTIALCMFKIFFQKKRHRLLLLLTITISFIVFILGSSRGAVISLAVSVLIFILFSPFKQKFKLSLLFALSIPVIIWSIEASGSNILKRLNSISDSDGSNGRNYLWKDAFDHFANYPYFGGKIEISGIYPHNFVLEILMATGILGAILIFPVIFKGLSLGIKLAKMNKQNLFILIIIIQAIIMHLFSLSIYTAILLFIGIGMVFNLSNINTKA